MCGSRGGAATGGCAATGGGAATGGSAATGGGDVGPTSIEGEGFNADKNLGQLCRTWRFVKAKTTKES